MDELETFTLAIFLASALGFALMRAKVSPVIAYIISGTILAFLGVRLSGDVFSFLSNFAVQVLAFIIGLTFDAESLRKTLSTALIIVITEVLIVGSVVSLVSSLFDLSLVEAIILLVSTLNTSSSIVFKQSSGVLPKGELDIALATSSIEDVVAFLGASVISGQLVSFSNALYLVVSSVGSFGLGLLLARYILTKIVKSSPSELTTLWLISFVSFFTLLGIYLKVPEILPPLLFGISLSLVLREGVEKIVNQIQSLLDFFLVIFFVLAGQEFTPSLYSLIFIPLAILAIGLKYFAFGIGYWIASGSFSRAFKTGLHMTPLSEFGIVVALSAISLGYKIGPIYDLVVIIVGTSFTLSGIIIRNEEKIAKRLNEFEATNWLVSRLNTLFASLRSRLYIPTVLGSFSNAFLLYFSVILGLMIASELAVFYINLLTFGLKLYIIVTVVVGTLIAMFYFSLWLRDYIDRELGLHGVAKEITNYFIYSTFILISIIYSSIVIRIVKIPSVLVTMAIPLSMFIYLTYIKIYKLLKRRTQER